MCGEEEEVVTRLVLHFIMLMKFNTHAITEAVLESRERPNLVNVIQVGSGLYPSLALVNASCDHNLAHYNVGSRAVAVAARDIQEGEEITDNYFPSYMLTGREERRAWLEEHYWYPCHCCACTADTPTMATMPPHPTTFPCPSPGCPGQLPGAPCGPLQGLCPLQGLPLQGRPALPPAPRPALPLRPCPHCGAVVDMDTKNRYNRLGYTKTFVGTKVKLW